MDSARLLPLARLVCPIGASISILVTMVTCVIIVKANDIWVSGLTWPFLSDMGRGTTDRQSVNPYEELQEVEKG